MAVRCFLFSLIGDFRRIGLEVDLDKTGVPSLRSPPSTPAPMHYLANFRPWRLPGVQLEGHCYVFNFSGSLAWCEALLGRRVAKAPDLLAGTSRFRDAQGAFCLLRTSSGWAKVLFSCRTVPPDTQFGGLRSADADTRAALSRLIGSLLFDDEWCMASPGIASGGLGARSATEHAPAAYVASFSACRGLCTHLWPAFDPLDPDEGGHLAAAEVSLRASIPSGAGIYAEFDNPSQKSLSGKIEAQAVSRFVGDLVLTRSRRLHFEAQVLVPG